MRSVAFQPLRFVFLLMFGIAVTLCCQASQNPDGYVVQWARSMGGFAADSLTAVSVDRFGRVHVAGQFRSSLASVGNLQLGSRGDADVVVAVYDRNGAVQWARSGGGVGPDAALALATDSQGNSLVAGYTSAGSVFGDTTLTNAGGGDAFLAKYDLAGNLRWALDIGGPGEERANAVAVDDADNVYVGGYFSKPADFGGLVLTNAGAVDLFLAKYDPDGHLVWARSAGGGGETLVNGVAVDASGGVFVTGHHADRSRFGDVVLPSAGGLDVFVARYTTAGELSWVRSGGGALKDDARAVASDRAGGVLVAGFLTGPATFDAVSNTNAGVRIFVVRYDAGGSVRWLRGIGGTEARGIAVNEQGAFVLGQFSPDVLVGTNTLRSAGGFDLSLTRFGLEGDILWARALGGTNADFGFGLAAEPERGLVLAGDYTVSTAFDATVLPASGGADKDGFVVRISPEPLISAVQPATLTVPPESDVSFSVTVDGADPVLLQWYGSDGAPIAGQTNATLLLSSVTPSMQGLYSAVATNLYGSATSAPAFLNIAGLPLPQILVNGARGAAFDVTNTSEVEVSLQVGASGVSLYYTTNGSAPNLASIPYTGPFKLGASRVIRAIAYDSRLASSQTPPVPVTFRLSPPVISVNGESGRTLFNFTNEPSVLVTLTAGLPAATLRYAFDGGPYLSNAYSSPLVITQSLTLRAFASLDGMVSATSAPVVIRLSSEFPLVLLPTTDGVVSVIPTNLLYTADSVVQLSAIPAQGWTFLGWTGDLAGTSPSQSLLMDKPKAVGASFGAPLTVSTLGAGSGTVVVDPSLPAYPRGATVRMWGIPDPGSFFALWTGAGAPAGSNNPSVFTVQSAGLALTGIFSPLPSGSISCVAVASGEGSVSASPQQSYYATNSTVLIQGVPNANRRLARWEIRAAGAPAGVVKVVEGVNPLSLTLTESVLVTGVFGIGPSFRFPATFTTESVTNADKSVITNTYVTVTLLSDPGAALRIDASNDMLSWERYRLTVNVSGSDGFRLPHSISNRFRFYRLVLP